MMFDGFLNVTLCEEASTTGLTQENLEIPLSPFFLSYLFIYLYIFYLFNVGNKNMQLKLYRKYSFFIRRKC